MSKNITIALAGNPNAGKTTIFNNLTGSHQHVGNYPGVTVEKKEGYLQYGDYNIHLVDLPGTYSLTAHSLDEIVARNFVIEEKPDAVIDVIDASNLERNLYLGTQLLELGVPLVLAFNMSDLAQKQGFLIDTEQLSKLLGTPIISTVASKNKGMNELIQAVITLIEGEVAFEGTLADFGQEIQEELAKLEVIIINDKALLQKYPSRWLATKLLEKDTEIIARIEQSPYANQILAQLVKSAQHLQKIFGDLPEAVIAERRYGFISGACSEAVQKTYELRHSTSDQIDNILVNRIIGLPIFLGLMWLVFRLTFNLSQPLMRGIEKALHWLAHFAAGLLVQHSTIQSLVVDGIISGVGSVLVFVPVIFLLFFALALLEDSGYMARAAFIMDRLMHTIGLHGRSFIPMLLGFGCTLPAIMATRTIDDRKDRLVTILITPFMSCGARLPVYALFIGAFFPEQMAGNVLFSLYLVGIVVAIIMARILRKYLLKGEATPFVMELPPYRMPTFKGLVIHMWERGVLYLRKAGTIIFAGCVLIWFLSNFPVRNGQTTQEKLENSYAGRLGKTIAPVFQPLGFDDWKLATGLIEGLIAKEIVVATLGTLHSVSNANVDSTSLRQALRNDTRVDGSKVYTPLVAYSAMVFILLYIPCISTIAVIKRETNSWVWPAFAVFYTTAVAWLAAFIVYQGGQLLGLGT